MIIKRNEYIGIPGEINCVRLYNSKGIAGLNVKLTIRNMSDDTYWTGSGWGALTELIMLEHNGVTTPGYYYYTMTFDAKDIYECHSYVATGKYAMDAYEIINVIDAPITINTQIDGMAYSYIMELSAAVANGKFSFDEDTQNLTIFKRDGITPLTVINVPDVNNRTRVS